MARRAAEVAGIMLVAGRDGGELLARRATVVEREEYLYTTRLHGFYGCVNHAESGEAARKVPSILTRDDDH